MYSPTVFLNEVPGWYMWTGIFLPVTALLLLFIAYLSWRIRKTEEELAMAADPRETASQLSFGPRYRRRKETRSRT
ncbi:small leucine-rich protein 1-like isoform X1 [Megalobrama amblycephala]|uniref:small leucine-rich protein 1-like isoform X1 n=1 Tax=Megalobrama amblycephala TaxID=75352 RepID=UPI002013DE33|nr:small leucine-rich protein 1-like isoform X1 [Megalobrama amblycephala]